jgi:hypothetical protein
MNKSMEFSQFVAFVKSQKEQGMCTTEEATRAILEKAQEIILSLRMPTPEEENMYQGVNYN